MQDDTLKLLRRTEESVRETRQLLTILHLRHQLDRVTISQSRDTIDDSCERLRILRSRTCASSVLAAPHGRQGDPS